VLTDGEAGPAIHGMSGTPAKRRRRATGAVAAGAAALAVGAILFWSAPGPSSSNQTGVPPPPASALRVPKPVELRRDPHLSLWSTVRRPVAARVAPNGSAATVTWLGTRAPEDTPNVVLVIGRAEEASGQVWVRVRLPVLPNGRTGWLPRRAIGGYVAVRTELIVDRARLRATLLRDGRPVFHAPVGIGGPRWPTPAGRFYVRNKLVRYRSPFDGPLAFGTSARSSTLTDWPDGGFVGIHGTNQPDLLPGRVSHGCIRMRNSDILRLGRLMPVGTPVTIR
jgi:lipoprotein-anchoring transpeptidase ErfK/SrfK